MNATRNPSCTGVMHRPDDPLYRDAVKRHAELGGTVEVLDAEIRDYWITVPGEQLMFDGWKAGTKARFAYRFEYRPVEPLRTDGYPDGMPDPGEGWRLLMKGEEVRDSDEVLLDGVLCVGRWSAIDGNKWIHHVSYAAVRRRITEDE